MKNVEEFTAPRRNPVCKSTAPPRSAEVVALDFAIAKLKSIRNSLFKELDHHSKRFDLADKLILIACQVRAVTLDQLQSRLRSDHVAATRFIVWHHAARYLDLTTTELGKLFGRDHTSVCNAKLVFAARYETDARFRADANLIEQKFLAATGLGQSWLDSARPVLAVTKV